MQNNLLNILHVDHILIDLDATDAQSAIRMLTAALVRTRHVASEFAEDVWRREETFPTGLPTQPLAIALPHADPDHVNCSAIGIGILNTPVQFGQMGTDGSVMLDVRMVFLLAIKEREKQVEMIQQLMILIQTGSLLEEIFRAGTPEKVLALIQKVLGTA